MTELQQAGQELDALIAARVFGLQVIRDWPCGWDDEGDYDAASTREAPDRPGFTKQDAARWRTRYSERGPVYDDPTDPRPYTPVPFYSTDIAAAWRVVEEMTKPARAARLESTRFAYWWDRARLWACSAEEAAAEICRAALACVTDKPAS